MSLIEVLRLQRDTGFELDIGGASVVFKETPTRGFEQFVYFDAGGGFFHVIAAGTEFGGRERGSFSLIQWYQMFLFQ